MIVLLKPRTRKLQFEELTIDIGPTTTVDEALTNFSVNSKITEISDLFVYFEGRRLKGDTTLYGQGVTDGSVLEISKEYCICCSLF